jgi:hypothetical protein
MVPDVRPGLDPRRLVRLMSAAIDRCRLDLAGRNVLTEAASGAYVATPVLAAMAGADVCALAAGTPYASSDEIRKVTIEVAALAGVTGRLEFAASKEARHIRAADIVTNSGQVRPIDAEMVAHMKPGAIIPLMYESWEFRASDVDLEACRSRGIIVAGTNEQHPDVDGFAYLGQLAVKQLHDAGIAIRGSRIVVLCDNSFGSNIVHDLRKLEAEVIGARRLTAEVLAPYCDAVLLALQPRNDPVLTIVEAELIRESAPGAVVVQYWGDTDRSALATAGVPVWPEEEPRAGHMGVLFSAIGPEAVIRLQAGGLKVGEVLARGVAGASRQELALVQIM